MRIIYNKRCDDVQTFSSLKSCGSELKWPGSTNPLICLEILKYEFIIAQRKQIWPLISSLAK